MPNAAYKLRLDPWAAEYEGSIQLAEDEEPVAVDIRVESPAWTAIQPPAAPRPRRTPLVAPPAGRGGAGVLSEPRSEPENTPVAPMNGLQKAMRQTEAGLAERLSAEVDVAFLDGPLSFVTAAARGRVLG